MRKKRKRIFIVLIIFILVGIALAFAANRFNTYRQTSQSDDESVQEIALEEGQYLKYARIDAISGNELSYTVMEESVQEGQTGELPDTPQEGQTMELPDMPQGRDSGDIPDMPQGRDSGELPDMPQGGQSGERTRMLQSSTVRYVETEETGQLQIPVGTEVITKLGTSTTFSRLSNGDIIAMVLQQDDSGNEVVMKIKIVE